MNRMDERMAMLEGEMDNLRYRIAQLEQENQKLKEKLKNQEIPFIGLRLNDE